MLFYYEPKVFWTLGGNGTTIRLFTDLDEKISLFDLSFYENPKNDPTVKYLTEHSIDEIFAGKNPDMVPDNVCIVEGGARFRKTSHRLHQERQVGALHQDIL